MSDLQKNQGMDQQKKCNLEIKKIMTKVRTSRKALI